MRVAGVKMTNAICFLIGPGQLMLLNTVIDVVINGKAGNNSQLTAASHGLSVKVKRRLAVLN